MSISTYRFQGVKIMTKDIEKHYADKHGKNVKISPELAAKIKETATEGKMPCAVAFKIAEDLDIKPAEVGVALDLFKIRIIKCQIGIFGYDKGSKLAKSPGQVPDALGSAIREKLAGGKLACRNAWQIAGELGIGKMDVTAACDAMGIKVSPCQLGAF
jgi:hypothetical protein